MYDKFGAALSFTDPFVNQASLVKCSEIVEVKISHFQSLINSNWFFT